MQIAYAGVCVTYTRMVDPALMCNIAMSVYLYCAKDAALNCVSAGYGGV